MAVIYYKKYDFKQLIDSPTVDAGKVEYINLPLSFDIETSTTPDSKKQAFMYIWQFGINGTAVYGRTWGEYWDFLGRLREALGLCGKRRAVGIGKVSAARGNTHLQVIGIGPLLQHFGVVIAFQNLFRSQEERHW